MDWGPDGTLPEPVFVKGGTGSVSLRFDVYVDALLMMMTGPQHEAANDSVLYSQKLGSEGQVGLNAFARYGRRGDARV